MSGFRLNRRSSHPSKRKATKAAQWQKWLQGKARPQRHTNGSNHKDCCGRGQAGHTAFGVQDGPGADKTDTGNNLRRNAGMVANAKFTGQPRGKNGEHGRAEADEHVGPQAGGTMLQLSFHSNDPTKDGSQRQLRQGS